MDKKSFWLSFADIWENFKWIPAFAGMTGRRCGNNKDISEV
jgi:hypothetical protein